MGNFSDPRSNPVHQNAKNISTQPGPTQPVGQPNLWTALVGTSISVANGALDLQADAQVKRLQSVENNAARLAPGARRRDHITPVLRSLHWLRCCGGSFSRLQSSYGNAPTATHLHFLPSRTNGWYKWVVYGFASDGGPILRSMASVMQPAISDNLNFFSLGVTAETLRANIDWNSAFLKGSGSI